MSRALHWIAGAVLLAAGCVSSEETTYAPYAGPPVFPNTRAPITLPTGDDAIITNSGSERRRVSSTLISIRDGTLGTTATS